MGLCSTMPTQKITYCLLTLNRLDELKTAIRRVAPFVDRTIIIDGFSTDGTKEWLDSSECEYLDVEYKQVEQHLYQYGNHNPDKRNPYIKMAGYDGWLLVTDTDECLKLDTCKNLRALITKAESEGYDGIKFQPHDIWTMQDGSIRNIEHRDFWNPMLWKSYPGQTYKGHTHVYIDRPEAVNNWMQTTYQYTHIKNEARIKRNSTQNYWTTVGLATNNTDDATWLGFHEIMKKYNYLDWHEFDKVMTAGTVPREITDWFKEHKDAENPEEASWYYHYFIILHPELIDV